MIKIINALNNVIKMRLPFGLEYSNPLAIDE